MATYYHHSLTHNHHHNHNSDIMSPQQQADGLQTLILMNPNFVGYSESHAPPQQQTSSNFLFHAPTLYHSQSPPLLPQLVGVPLQDTAGYQGTWTTQLGHLQTARDSPRVQQGLSLTLSSTQNHSSDHLQPSPTAVAEGSQSPAAMGDASAMNSSKYLKAAQELLEEMVNVSVDRVKTESGYKKSKSKSESSPGVDSVAGDCSKDELSTSDKQELQMKKAKLITLLDEVDQRQRQYHNQMQAVVASFEQVAGANTARTYTSLALKTISNQFRCLRGAISGQIRIANKGLGEGEGEGGSSSRLKMLDHQMRQQRALQQLGMIQNNAWRPQRGLPEKAVSVLRAWLFEHFLHPYPKDSDKIMLAKQTGLTRSQVSNWFINARVRLWKPMIEEMYAEEVKENEQNGSNGKTRKQDQENEEPGSIDEKDDNLDDEQAKITENHSSSIMFSSSNPYKPNTENSFAFIESSKMDNDTQGRLKKQRTNEILSSFPNSELFNNGCKEEVVPTSASGFLGGLVSYPIGELGRFGDGQYPAGFPANGGVSLTLGLPHCESLNNQVQGFMPNNQDIDQFRGRLELGELNSFGSVKAPNAPHSGNAYSGQLLHDFVA